MMIIVAGLPGSGKSYFASRLAKEREARYISSDLTRKEMEAGGRYEFDNKLDVYKEMARRTGVFMRKGEEVVVDATFYRHEMRSLFFALANLLREKVAYLEIVANEDLIRKRISTPRLSSEADYSVYKLIRQQYEKIDNKHLVIESKSDNIESMLEIGKDYIRRINEGT